MNYSIFILLLIALFVFPSSGEVLSHTKTDQRSVQLYWSNCDACVCHYFRLDAFEQNGKNLGSYGSEYDYFRLYFGHSEFNSCTSTYTSSYLYDYDEVPELWISPSARNARITNLDGLVNSNGENVSINLEWAEASRVYQCNCREEQESGPLTYKFSTKSRSTATDVSGTIVIGDRTFELDGVDGYIYGSGYKSLITTHL